MLSASTSPCGRSSWRPCSSLDTSAWPMRSSCAEGGSQGNSGEATPVASASRRTALSAIVKTPQEPSHTSSPPRRPARFSTNALSGCWAWAARSSAGGGRPASWTLMTTGCCAWRCCCRLASRTADQARTAFVALTQQALLCLSDAVVYYRPAPVGQAEILIVSKDPVRLPRDAGAALQLTLDQQYIAGQRGGLTRSLEGVHSWLPLPAVRRRGARDRRLARSPRIDQG